MSDAMVTARMSQSKKDAGNSVLNSLGLSASQAINELYDRVIATRSWPFDDAMPAAPIDSARLAEALAFVDGIARVDPNEFTDMSFDEARRRRLIAKGRASEDELQ